MCMLFGGKILYSLQSFVFKFFCWTALLKLEEMPQYLKTLEKILDLQV